MKKISIYIIVFMFSSFTVKAQEEFSIQVFEKEPINFKGEKGTDAEVKALQNGRVIYKKIIAPNYPDGTDVQIKLVLRSNGDRWDKSGSCFVVTNPKDISIINVAKNENKFPDSSNVDEKHRGVKATNNYKPVVEILRFMTPFGVGYYSNDKGKHRKPVYIPKWEKEVVWEHDISDLTSIVSNTFYVGIKIDTWTKEGYNVDLSFTYSNRPKVLKKVMPLVNTVAYVKGQSLPNFFAKTSLEHAFELPKNAKNVKLYYITTGHGGHSGGDEFIKIKNSVYVDNALVLDTIPWRDDCASFRRFNPTSGVWLKKDSASYIDTEERKYKIKEIEERIASSDLSRSNWCPGSFVKPYEIELKQLKPGEHTVEIKIPATEANKEKFNHWLVSAYITYED